MVESEEHDTGTGLNKGQTKDGMSTAVEISPTHNKKKKKMSTVSRQMTYLIDVNLHLELAMATQKMVEIREDSEESSEAKDDGN